MEYDFGRTKADEREPESQHSEAQIIAALKQVEAGRAGEDLARELIAPVKDTEIYADLG